MAKHPGDSDSRLAYVRIADALRDAYVPGAQLPNLDQLAEQHSASKVTIRRAIAELTDEGMVSVVHGVGTFYADERPAPADDTAEQLASISAQLNALARQLAALIRRHEPDAAASTKPSRRRKGPNPDIPASEYRFLP